MQMQSFIGQARTSIDSKGRTAFPREFRRFLSEEDGAEFVVTWGPRQSLILFTIKEWNDFQSELAARPFTQANSRFMEQIQHNAAFCEMDCQNRISIPPALQKFASLKDDVVFAARRNKTASLWNPERFDAIYGTSTPDALEAFDAGFFPGNNPEVQR
jgi:MraZ protein